MGTEHLHYIEITLLTSMAARVWALTTDCLVNSWWKMFMFMPYKFPTFIFEPAFRKIRGYLNKLWKLVKHLHNNFLFSCLIYCFLIWLAICKLFSLSTFKNDELFSSFAPVISLLQSASLSFVLELDCKQKKSIYFSFFSPTITSLL